MRSIIHPCNTYQLKPLWINNILNSLFIFSSITNRALSN